jgi:hypothetical protein
MVLGRSFSTLAIGVGGILGFIWGNRIKDNQEQARINREIERDRAKYENTPSGLTKNHFQVSLASNDLSRSVCGLCPECLLDSLCRYFGRPGI